MLSMVCLSYRLLATTKYKGPSKLATIVAMPSRGRGMPHKASNLKKKGIQIKSVGNKAKTKIAPKVAKPFFITLILSCLAEGRQVVVLKV